MKLPFVGSLAWGGERDCGLFICISLDKNYFALLSITYNSQSCKIAERQ